MVLRYNVCDVDLKSPRKFPYDGKFPYPGFLQLFLLYLIPVLPYPGKFPYLVKVSIRKSTYFLESNNN